MKKHFFHFILLFVVTGLSVSAQVGCVPEKPSPQRLVNDLANVLSPNFEQQVERYLVGFNDTTSTQITLVTPLS